MTSKRINVLIVLSGPALMALTQIWEAAIPFNFGGFPSFALNGLLMFGGGVLLIFKGIPALFRLAPKSFVSALRQNL